MMEEFYAKSGDRILRIGEKYLCSAVDPRTEAERWVAGHRAKVHKAKGLLILGLGAGYHIAQLRKQYPSKKIVIFEQNERCIQFAERLFPIELFDVPIVSENLFDKVIADPAVKAVLSSRYTILRHAPSAALNEPWYDFLEKELLGRSLTSLRSQLGVQSTFKAFEGTPLLWGESTPIDWRIFDHLNDGQLAELSDLDFFVLKALRELIK